VPDGKWGAGHEAVKSIRATGDEKGPPTTRAMGRKLLSGTMCTPERVKYRSTSSCDHANLGGKAEKPMWGQIPQPHWAYVGRLHLERHRPNHIDGQRPRQTIWHMSAVSSGATTRVAHSAYCDGAISVPRRLRSLSPIHQPSSRATRSRTPTHHRPASRSLPAPRQRGCSPFLPHLPHGDLVQP